jgi:parallel beta-helix repeat protein
MKRPFRTIRHAIARAKSGDQINVRRGTYKETVTIWEKSGPIRLSPYMGEKVILDGTGSDANGVVVIGQSSHIRVDGFEVRNGAHAGIYVYDSHHVTIIGNEVHDCGGGGINAMSSTETKLGTTHDVTISGNEVYHCVLSNRVRRAGRVWMQAISAYRADRVEISSNYVYENYGEGIDYIVSDHGTIRGNTIRDNFSINLYLDNAQTTVVDGNQIWCSAQTTFRRDDGPPAAIMAANEDYPEQNPLDQLTITNNFVARCQSGFSYWNGEHGGGLHHTVVSNNVFYATNYAGVWLPDAGHSTTVVANNVVYQKYGRPYADASGRGVTFRHNAWFGGGDESTIRRGPGDVLTDPLLVNPGGGEIADYKLQPRSPLIDAGSPDGDVPADFFGTARAGRGKTRDIGLHEY